MDDLPFKVVRSNGRDEVFERSTNVLISRAAFEKAVELYPNDLILLQQGARIIAKSTELDPTPGRARQTMIDNYLALVVRKRLWTATDYPGAPCGRPKRGNHKGCPSATKGRDDAST